MTRIVVALGGNALMRRGEPGSMEAQRGNLRVAARAVVDLHVGGHELVLTHGNGPQVGYLAIEADAARAEVPPPPLDVLVAESQGQIGYLLTEALHAELLRRGRSCDVVAVLTRTLVAADDPAFSHPTKPVGPMYDEATARRLASEHGWTIAADGAGWRRVVPSPEPLEIVEGPAVRRLVDGGAITIASGGGGIPVRRADGAFLVGVEAVVDKDLAAVVLAEAVDADALLLLTDVTAVHARWRQPDAEPIARLSIRDAVNGIRDGTFAAGSMGPKVMAAVRFAERTGGLAAIGALERATDVLEGRSGTVVVANPAHPFRARNNARRKEGAA